MLAVKGYKLGTWLACHIPTSVSYRLAAVAGEVYYWAARQHSRKADENMRIVLDAPQVNRQVRRYARMSFRNYFKYMVDFVRQGVISYDDMKDLTTESSWQPLYEAEERGKGTILAACHYGNWDGAALLFSGLGKPVSAVAQDFKPAELNELIQAGRVSKGMKLYSPEGALRGLYTSLKNGEFVALLVDAPVLHSEIVVNFFGRPARFPVGPASIAFKTGASVIMGYVVRQPGDRYFYGVWEKPIHYELTGQREQDLYIITQSIADELERLVRRHPDQWYMFRKLWLSDEEIAAGLAQPKIPETATRKPKAAV